MEICEGACLEDVNLFTSAPLNQCPGHDALFHTKTLPLTYFMFPLQHSVSPLQYLAKIGKLRFISSKMENSST